jgi:hypothetical protein
MRQRLHEDAQTLPQAHAQREHDGSADQDRKRGTQDLQQGHFCFCHVPDFPLILRSGASRVSKDEATSLASWFETR